MHEPTTPIYLTSTEIERIVSVMSFYNVTEENISSMQSSLKRCEGVLDRLGRDGERALQSKFVEAISDLVKRDAERLAAV